MNSNENQPVAQVTPNPSPSSAVADDKKALEEKEADVNAVNAPKQKWLPIESAPKDGSMVDLWFGRRETNCYWGRPDHSCGEAGPYCDSCPDHDGWCATDGFIGYLTGRDGIYKKAPTHWMPLPDAPSVGRPTEEQSAHPVNPNSPPAPSLSHVQQMERDTQRMDFLEQHPSDLQSWLRADVGQRWTACNSRDGMSYASAREAIDAAMGIPTLGRSGVSSPVTRVESEHSKEKET